MTVNGITGLGNIGGVSSGSSLKHRPKCITISRLAMEALFFNVRFLNCDILFSGLIDTVLRWIAQVDSGFLEGIVRGYKAGILTQGQYGNLTQCESLEGAHGQLISSYMLL